MKPFAEQGTALPVRKLRKLAKAIVPVFVLRSRALSCVCEKLPPKVTVCLPWFQMALAEGLQRFWKIPVNAPCDAAVPPMFKPALKTKLVLAAAEFPKSSTMVMPGKTEDPNALMFIAAGVKGWPMVL